MIRLSLNMVGWQGGSSFGDGKTTVCLCASRSELCGLIGLIEEELKVQIIEVAAPYQTIKWPVSRGTIDEGIFCPFSLYIFFL